MGEKKKLTVLMMDPPYESANTMTAFRIIESALTQGNDVNVFAFEGAVSLALAGQKSHPNPVKKTDSSEENHPLTKDFIRGLFSVAKANDVVLDWVNCGFCVDERGADSWVEGPRRGGPPDFAKFFNESDQTLVMTTN